MFLPAAAEKPSLRPQQSDIRESDWAVLARYWHPVARTADVAPDTPFATRLLDVDLVLYRGGEGITVAHDMCPHRWVKLSAGKMDDGAIVCPFHGLTFNGTGACVRVPALGREAKLPPSYRVRTFPSVDKYGLIWVLLDDTSHEQVPTFPKLEGYHESALMFSIWLWPMSAARQVENFFDLAHLPYVHATTLGGDPFGRIAPASIEQHEKSVRFTAKFTETVPFEQPTECSLVYDVFLPFSIQFTSTPDGSTGFTSLNIASPTTAHTTRVFQLIARGDPGEIFAEGSINLLEGETGPGVINQQDIDVLATLQIQDMPLSERLEIHLPVDNVSAAYRTRLREIGLGK